jgi:predicted nucleic acid-binding protein
VTGVRRPVGVLDTSFWTVAFQGQLTGYAMSYFEIVVPTAVEQEIRRGNHAQPTLRYPAQVLFEQVRPLLTDPPGQVMEVSQTYGAGECDATNVALQLGAALLINDVAALQYARTLGARIVTVPHLIVLLRAGRLITDARAPGVLDMVSRQTAAHLVKEAEVWLDRLKEPGR